MREGGHSQAQRIPALGVHTITLEMKEMYLVSIDFG